MSPALRATHFFVNNSLLAQAESIARCYDERVPSLDEAAGSQFAFELDAVRSLRGHPLRTLDPSRANLFYLPLVAFASAMVGTCSDDKSRRTTHRERQEQMWRALQDISNGPFASRPHILACTCGMLEAERFYGKRLVALLRSMPFLVQLVHEPRPAGLAASRVQVVVPYHSVGTLPAAVHAKCDATRPTLALFMGSLQVGDPGSTRLRERLLDLSRATTSVAVLPSARPAQCLPPLAANVSATAANASAASTARSPQMPCVGAMSTHGHAKSEMASAMANATLCLTPPGDTPASSRLFDAIAALCVPVLFSPLDGAPPLQLPQSAHWRGAFLLLNSSAFLTAPLTVTADALQRVASGQLAASRCAAVRTLRASLAARGVLTRALLTVAEFARTNWSWIQPRGGQDDHSSVEAHSQAGGPTNSPGDAPTVLSALSVTDVVSEPMLLGLLGADGNEHGHSGHQHQHHRWRTSPST